MTGPNPTKLTIVTGSCGRNDVNAQFFETTIANCVERPELIWNSQAATEDENKWLAERFMASPEMRGLMLTFDEAMGTTRAFNEGLRYATGEIVAMLHNDLLIDQPGWDRYVIEFFETHPGIGLVGFAGGKAIGSGDLYRTPYQLQQLARGHVYTSLTDWWHHGLQTIEPTEVVVLDGLAIIGRREQLEAWGGFDEHYFHHCYDNDLSLTSYFGGCTNYVLPIACRHLNGQTANFERYGAVAARVGGDAEVHRVSHLYMYNKWRGKLPVRIP